MEDRFTFNCWYCRRDYTLYKVITTEQTLIVACPFCNKEGVVKLDPYKKEKETVIKGGSQGDAASEFEFVFPEVIPTQEPD